MDPGLLVGLVSMVVFTAAGVWVIAAALRYRTRALELQHQQRLAMIEKGLVPPPELTGLTFVAGVGKHMHERRAVRSMSLGIIVIGLGLAFMTLVGVAAEAPETGLGIGGAIAIVGAAFIVRSLVVGPMPVPTSGPPPGMSPQPPPIPDAKHEPSTAGRDQP
jgi:hypothetical protein